MAHLYSKSTKHLWEVYLVPLTMQKAAWGDIVGSLHHHSAGGLSWNPSSIPYSLCYEEQMAYLLNLLPHEAVGTFICSRRHRA
jgi:hypothetical protein